MILRINPDLLARAGEQLLRSGHVRPIPEPPIEGRRLEVGGSQIAPRRVEGCRADRLEEAAAFAVVSLVGCRSATASGRRPTCGQYVAAEPELRLQAAAANSINEHQETLTMKIPNQVQLAILVQRPGQLSWAKRFFRAHLVYRCSNFVRKNELSAGEFQNRTALFGRKAIMTGVRRIEFRLQPDYPRVGLENPSLLDSCRSGFLQEIFNQAIAVAIADQPLRAQGKTFLQRFFHFLSSCESGRQRRSKLVKVLAARDQLGK
jgi:hypothetical protein